MGFCESSGELGFLSKKIGVVSSPMSDGNFGSSISAIWCNLRGCCVLSQNLRFSRYLGELGSGLRCCRVGEEVSG